MSALVAIAIKSLAVAGLTLLLLRLLANRSAAERSWIAHLGLTALLLLAFAPLILPRWTVEAPAVFASATPTPSAAPVLDQAPVRVNPSTTILPQDEAGQPQAAPPLSGAMIAVALYAVPAVILLFFTALALARLVALRARAEVLVDSHWLSALARAQRRMGFKHGTALLTSDDLKSPVSWGMMRPVILLNQRAVDASGEAEAIIAHELAHVAKMDWIKLLLSRVVVALFWFNPLVWMLAREAHQLREETADDAVLAANIVDTDYAQLLAGVARHDCPGLLLGAHGVAPSKSSLSRRIARVLDSATTRSPANRSFAAGMIVGAAAMAAPLAAITLVPADQDPAPATAAQKAYAASQPTDLGSLMASGIKTSIDQTYATVAPDLAPEPTVLESNPRIQVEGAVAEALSEARAARSSAHADHIVARAIAEARAGARAEAGAQPNRSNRRTSLDDDELTEMFALGLTPEYIAEMRSASPALRTADVSEIVGLKNIGASASFVRGLVAAGYGRADADELTEARAVGVDGAYAKSLQAVGLRPDLDELIQMRAVGVTADFVRRMQAAGYRIRDPDRLIELYAVGGGRVIAPPRGSPPRTFDPPPLPRPGGT